MGLFSLSWTRPHWSVTQNAPEFNWKKIRGRNVRWTTSLIHFSQVILIPVRNINETYSFIMKFNVPFFAPLFQFFSKIKMKNTPENIWKILDCFGKNCSQSWRKKEGILYKGQGHHIATYQKFLIIKFNELENPYIINPCDGTD